MHAPDHNSVGKKKTMTYQMHEASDIVVYIVRRKKVGRKWPKKREKREPACRIVRATNKLANSNAHTFGINFPLFFFE